MAEKNESSNAEKALKFLQHFRKEGRLNLVSIHPTTGQVNGITRDMNDPSLLKFIEQSNGKNNLYFSVNEPSAKAPDGKLKKHHIEKIHAVWLDADPAKNVPFEDEKHRLDIFSDKLASGENPPSYIIDSGGGIQAFWAFEKPINATPGNIEQAEALSRGLADTHGTDRVHNIDRIMRIPYTVNMPTPKKIKQGRTKTIAKPKHVDKRYSKLKFITPTFASDADLPTGFDNYDTSKLKDTIPPDLQKLLDQEINRNPKIDQLWNKTIHKPSRSDYDFTLTKELKWAGFDIDQISQIIWCYPHGKQDENSGRDLARNFNRVENPFNDLPAEYVEQIDKQTNPLTTAKQELKKFMDSGFISIGEATIKNSGTPLFKNFMNRETVNVLYGPSGSGKSFLTLDMALHLAAGLDWAGFKCREKMAVLYVCTESGSSFGKRAVAARRKLGIPENAPLTDFPFAYYPAYVDLLNEKQHIKKINQLIHDLEQQSDHKCGLVVIDTLSAAFGGGNENNEDMTKFVNNMASIKFKSKVSPLIVHHTGKDEAAGARGHSSLKANIDTEIRVKSEKRGDKYTRSFESTKQKDDELKPRTPFALSITTLGHDIDNDPITSCYVIFEDDTEFNTLTPNWQEELSPSEKAALDVINLYIKENPNPDITGFTELQLLTLLHHDVAKNNFAIVAKDPETGELLSISKELLVGSLKGMMERPNRAKGKLFKDHRNKLGTFSSMLNDEQNQLLTRIGN